MPRFFVEAAPGEEYLLAGEDGRHLVRSLRARPGEEVTLCDGRGEDFRCVFVEARGDAALLRVEERLPNRAEPRMRATVCQCLAKGDKLETVTQKAVELGAAAVRLVESSRCVVRLEGPAAGKKAARLQKIAREAAMQSGRGVVPPVLPPLPLGPALEEAARQEAVFFLYEGGGMPLSQAAREVGERVSLFVGPEGGFSPQEAALAKSLGAVAVTLGPRVLRTETAALAALSALFCLSGDME